jgi:hypothetical protein
MKLTIHLHLVPRSTNAWSYTSTPQNAYMPWCSKHRDNFTFTLPFQMWRAYGNNDSYNVTQSKFCGHLKTSPLQQSRQHSASKHHNMKAYGGQWTKSPRILDLSTRWTWEVIFRLVKVKLSLCLTKHHAIKTYWGSGSFRLETVCCSSMSTHPRVTWAPATAERHVLGLRMEQKCRVAAKIFSKRSRTADKG